jgi:hypothetical protein
MGVDLSSFHPRMYSLHRMGWARYHIVAFGVTDAITTNISILADPGPHYIKNRNPSTTKENVLRKHGSSA